MIIEQRRYLWREDTVDKLSAWIGLKPGMTMVDMGCGLGYLGYTYWPYFGDRGRYIGIDRSINLLRDARSAAAKWAENGSADFIAGDVYRTPLGDGAADVVICQTLLMHMDKPEEVLTEMIRIARPGGVVVCKEPDNLSASLARHYNSLPDPEIDDWLLTMKITILAHYGRIKLGRGDDSIGPRVPRMMQLADLTDIDCRKNDTVRFLNPPYDSPDQQHYYKMTKKRMLDHKTFQFWVDRIREEFLAGGGTEEEFNRHMKWGMKYRDEFRKQVEAGEFYGCSSGYFYIIIGRKPF